MEKQFLKILKMEQQNLKISKADLKELKDGGYVLAEVHNSYTIGEVIQMDDKRWYIFQNAIAGGRPEVRDLNDSQKAIYNRYPMSWCFYTNLDKNECTDGVEIIKIASSKEELVKIRDEYGLNIVSQKGLFKFLRGDNPEDYTTLFKHRFHSDCCGALELFHFCPSDTLDYSKYKDIKPIHIEQIKRLLYKFRRHAIAHLAGYQIEAKKFVEKLGMTPITEFKNPNSGNTVTIYEFKPDNCENTE